MTCCNQAKPIVCDVACAVVQPKLRSSKWKNKDWKEKWCNYLYGFPPAVAAADHKMVYGKTNTHLLFLLAFRWEIAPQWKIRETRSTVQQVSKIVDYQFEVIFINNNKKRDEKWRGRRRRLVVVDRRFRFDRDWQPADSWLLLFVSQKPNKLRESRGGGGRNTEWIARKKEKKGEKEEFSRHLLRLRTRRCHCWCSWRHYVLNSVRLNDARQRQQRRRCSVAVCTF